MPQKNSLPAPFLVLTVVVCTSFLFMAIALTKITIFINAYALMR